MARLAAQIVGRAHYPRFLVEVAVDLSVTVGVVAERDRVDPGFEQAGSDLGGDARATGRVLGVGDDERRSQTLAQGRQEGLYGTSTGAADDVADEEDPYRVRCHFAAEG